jgi:hypothetical protein
MKRLSFMALLVATSMLLAGCQCRRPYWGGGDCCGYGYGAYPGGAYYGTPTMMSSPSCCNVNYGAVQQEPLQAAPLRTGKVENLEPIESRAGGARATLK